MIKKDLNTRVGIKDKSIMVSKDEQNRRVRTSYWKNRDKRIEAKKEWAIKNKNKVKEYEQKYRQEHKEECKKRNLKWRKSNREKINILQREKQKVRNYAYTRLRAIMLKEIGKCENCGSTEKLEIHHEDYKNKEKVKLLCKKCHQKETNKSLGVNLK